jgi:hypothetical protein
MGQTKPTPTIVKVQLPLMHPEADALIYAAGNTRAQMRKLDREDQYKMRGRMKAYFNAWWSDATGWVLLERCDDQPW